MENHLFPIKASNVSSNTIAIDAHHKFPQKIDQHCKVLYNMVQCSSRLAAAFCVVTLHNDIIMSDGLHGLVGKLFQKKINHPFCRVPCEAVVFHRCLWPRSSQSGFVWCAQQHRSLEYLVNSLLWRP